MLFKFKTPYHLARFILFSRSNLEVGILIQNKVNICKSIFMWNTGRIVHSYTTCTWICFASNVLWLQYSGRIPHVQWFIWRYSRASIFFPDWALYQFFPSFYCFHFLPCLILTRSIKGHFVVFGVVHEPLPTQWDFFFIETELTNINWK